MADRNYIATTQGDDDATDAAKHTVTYNFTDMAAGATSATWIYPGNAKSMFWVNNAATPGASEKIFLAIRGAAGGAGTAQLAVLKDDAPNTPATDAHASTTSSMIAGQCPGNQIPHEFTMHNAGSSVAQVTLYINY